jgi:hypothetical protein
MQAYTRAFLIRSQVNDGPVTIYKVLLGLHSPYGPPDRFSRHRRPLSRGSNPCSYPHKPLVSYRINRQLSGWTLPPQVMRAFGAHGHNRTHAPQQKIREGLSRGQFRVLVCRVPF